MKYIPSAKLDYIPASHEDPANPGVLKKVFLTFNDHLHGTVQMLNRAKLLPNKSFRKHAHTDMTEMFIMIEGEAIAIIAEKTVLLLPGDVLIVEPGEPHEMTNGSDMPVYFLAVGFVPETN